MTTTQNGYFLIADITGYTAYLNQSELEHAHEVLQALMQLLIEHTRPPLIISRLAGDAVISYGLRDNFLSGQTFMEMIETTYVAFRRAIELMVLNTTCDCRACANIQRLDLKFFVHYGTFTRQQLDQHDELLGADVIVIHRLLKNQVTEKTGWRAYALYTDSAVRQLDIVEVGATMTEHVETYEHLGEVKTWVQNMHPVWEAKKDEAQLEIAPGDILAYQEGEFPLPPAVMWDIVTDPEYRAIFMQSIRQETHNRQRGRLDVGSQYECFHGGNRITRQIILEWQPFVQMTTMDTTPVPGATCLINIRLTPKGTGTRLSFTSSKGRGPWLSRLLLNLSGRPIITRQFRNGMQELQERLAREIAEGRYALPPEEADLTQETIAAAVRESLRE